MDWNNDGRKDLVTGEYDGFIRVYLNTHTDDDPVFQGFFKLQINESDFDCGHGSMPHIMDWNGDGRKDVLCGELGGTVLLLINTGKDEDPVFDAAKPLKDGHANLDAGYFSAPTVADWNRDGKKDLLVGEMKGTILYFENQGTDEDPLFNGSSALKAGPGVLDVDHDAHPDVIDWDEDGVLDILCGDHYGNVHYFHALGPLWLGENAIQAGAGGRIDLHLKAGALNGGRNYLVLGSMSGTEPGTPLPGGKAVLPVNWDLFTGLVIDLLNTPVFSKFMGVLDGNGEAAAEFNTLGPVPGAAGIYLSFAYALNGPWDYASNGATVEIIP